MTTEYLNNDIFTGIIERFQRSKKAKARYELIIEDVRVCQRRRKICDAFVTNHVNQYNTVSEHFKVCQTELAGAFLTLSENIVRYAKFNLIDEQDAIQEGVMICFEKIDRFDPVKGKAFNYMTTCILNHYRQLYRTARNYNELKRKYLVYLEARFDEFLKTNRKNKKVPHWFSANNA